MRTRVEHAATANHRRLLVPGSAFLLGVALVGLPVPIWAASPAPTGAASANIVKYATGITMQSLAGRADTDMVEFSNGKRMSVRSLRSLQALQQRMRAVTLGSKLPAALRLQPAASGTPVKNASDLAAALKRPDADTIALPDGQRITVGLLRFLQPLVEKRLGRRLDTGPQALGPAGPPVRVSRATTEAEWRAIMQRPENTILELPSGAQIPVGAWKAGLMQFAEARQLQRSSGAAGGMSPKTPPVLPTPKGKK
jgi:hypothetical protein